MLLRYFFENIILYFDNITQKKNFNFLRKESGIEIETFFDVGFHKGETTELANKLRDSYGFVF